MNPDSPKRNRWRALVAAATSLALTAAGAALAPAATAATEPAVTTTAAEPTAVDGVTLDWALNAETGGGAYFGGCNFLSAGIAGDTGSSRVWAEADGFYQTHVGNTTIVKPTADGTDLAQPTWATKCQTPSGTAVTTSAGSTSETRVQIANGAGSVDVAAGTAQIEWEGAFTVAFYGGMTYWSASNPVLTVNSDGSGTLTATASGYGADMNDTSKWLTLEPRTITLATLSGVEIDEDGFTISPDYVGVSIETTAGAQVTTGDNWGSFPQSFVDFQVLTGQSSYWYSSGGAADAKKVAAPLTVDWVVPVVEEPTEIEVEGAQLEWAYSGYAQTGVFGPWRMWTEGTGVTIADFGLDHVTGNEADATTMVTGARFDGGVGTLDAETGAGTITWPDTGAWVINAYPDGFGAPDETLSAPILTINEDGSGTLSFVAFIPEHLDYMHGDEPMPDVGPDRVVVATFSSVSFVDGVLHVTPDFAGREYDAPDNLGAWQTCDGAGGSWPASWINFVTDSVKAHYYTTSCLGLNMTKPPYAFTVSTVASDVTITQQPTGLALDAGAAGTVQVAFDGNPSPAIAWQKQDGEQWTTIEGLTASTWDIAAATIDDIGTYRVVLTGGSTSVISETFTIEVDAEAPTVTTPTVSSVEYAPGETVDLRTTPTGKPTPALQWQRSDDNGETWIDVPDATEWRFTFAAALADNGAIFRVVADNGVGDPVVTESSAALVVAENNVVITEQPTSFVAPSDKVSGSDSVRFQVEAGLEREVEGVTPTFTYQWQRFNASTSEWDDISGSAGRRYYYSLDTDEPENNGARLRVTVSRGESSVTSNEVTLTIIEGLAPRLNGTTYPTLEAGVEATLETTLLNSPTPEPSYQWFRSDDDGETWTEVVGETGTALTFTPTLDDDGVRFEVRADNGVPASEIVDDGEPYSTARTFVFVVTVAEVGVPTITTQPDDTRMTVFADELRQFAYATLAAKGLPAVSYQWQVSTDGGGNWTDVEGQVFTTLTVTNPTAEQNGSLYRAKVYNDEGEVFSDVVELTTVVADGIAAMVFPDPITTDAERLYITGANFPMVDDAWLSLDFAVFEADDVTAGVRPDPALAVSTVSGTSATIVRIGEGSFSGSFVTPLSAFDPEKAYVLAIYADDESVRDLDLIVPLMIEGQSLPAIDEQPTSTGVYSGASAELSVVASGTPAVSYRWQVLDGEEWTDVADATSSTLTLSEASASATYRVVVANGLGEVVSDEATVAVVEPQQVTGAQLEWAYSQYAQSGVFGAWWQEVSGANVALAAIDAAQATGDPTLAGTVYTGVRFDGGVGEINPVTGAGTITWSTGTWTLNAYKPAYDFAPDEVISNPVLTIAEDGTGTLTVDAYLGEHIDFMSGTYDIIPETAPERVVIATFSNVSVVDGVITIAPDFTGREPVIPEGLSPWNSCDGVGGSWPQEWLDFVPGTVMAHYYTTSCSGLNLRKPPLQVVVTTVATAPAIVSNPSSTNAVPGTEVTFEAAVAGNPNPAVQWQRSVDDGLTWTDIEGATGTEYTTVVDEASYSTLVRITAGDVVSDAATVGRDARPVIRTQPVNTQAVPGDDATLFVEAFSGLEVTYVWQEYDASARTWNDVADSDSPSLTLTDVVLDDNNRRFRVVVSNTAGSITSTSRYVYVQEAVAPTITENPTDQVAVEGGPVTFTTYASGYPAPVYQLERLGAGGEWTAVGEPVSSNPGLSSVSVDDDGATFRVLAIGHSSTEPAVTGTVTLSVATLDGLTLTAVTDPASLTASSAYLQFAVGGYQGLSTLRAIAFMVLPLDVWQARDGLIGQDYRALGEYNVLGPVDLTAAGGYGKAAINLNEDDIDTDTVYVLASMYIDANGLISANLDADNAIILDVAGQSAPAFTTQPASVGVIEGTDVALAAEVTGYPVPTLQWQQSSDGVSWSDIDGETGASLEISDVSATLSYRLVATSALGTAESEVATVTSLPQPQVTVSKTQNLDADGEIVTVTGTGFLANPSATTATRPPLAGSFGGVYVVFGTFAENWQPSTGGSGRTVLASKWVVDAADVDTIGGAAAGAVAINPDGSFEVQIEVASGAVDKDGSYGIYTYAAGGAVYAPFETATPVTIVESAPSVSTQPSDVVAPVSPATGDAVAQFSIAATGEPMPSVQWQRLVDGEWTDITDETANTLAVSYSAADDGAQFRAVASNGLGSATSDAAVLTVGERPQVTVTAPSSIVQGKALTIDADVSGTATVLQWQVRAPGETQWQDIVGADATTLEVAAADVRNGQAYRLVVSGPIPQIPSGAVEDVVSATVLVALAAPSGEPTDVPDSELGEPGGVSGTETAEGTYKIQVGEQYAGQYVGVWVHSTPQNLGWFLVDASGAISVTIPADLEVGDHRIVVVDSSGALIGTLAITVEADGTVSVLSSTGGTAPIGGLIVAALMVVLGAALIIRRRQPEYVEGSATR
ncbi:hypothetical protein GCM10009808_23310 [Microbacterium sediminicola]|uniref:Ig-like domain-containing protein n=1 Tax=Microbacterium sediminicola TaxID=415210 RepID=A0ABN2IGJ1_9MICO